MRVLLLPKPALRNLLSWLPAFLWLATAPVRGASVEAEGRAPGDQANAREIALTEALREAVRTGAGVDVLGNSGVKDFNLEFDRILSSAFGHVKTYKILNSGLGKDGIYRVRVKADVEKGAPDAKNTLALRQIVQMRGSPRVSIALEEQIDGVSGTTRYAQGILEQIAREIQIAVADPGTARSQESRMATRDEILGNTRSAKLRSAGFSQKSDFLIEGRISARYVGRQSSFGSLPQHVYSVGGELRALLPETGEVVVTVALPGTEKIESDLDDKEMAARDVIQKLLTGERQKKQSPLFGKILAHWLTEADLGSVKRVELAGVSNELYQKLRGVLSETEKISAVWPREFDSEGISVLDVETRLDTGALGMELGRISEGRLTVDRSTQHLISCKVASFGQAAPPAPSTPAAVEPPPQAAVQPSAPAPAVAPKRWWWPF